ncbi:hypothetical protein LTR09_012994 [Extremus antarcticus]|uniref:Uncharacterized protein n=1 Tax=Extremus antarcticus TaxID=702011 RepID=A0AAJ0G3I3_9PEZI|nr:hypothetical protein LTR09_012994 [Extremus antarcticus]
MADHIDDFFAQYPSFSHDRANSSPREFYRMCDQFQWKKRQDNACQPARKEAWEKFRVAMVVEFNSRFGTDAEDVFSWKGICEFLQMNPMPSGVESMRKAVINTHINLTDMLDSKRRGEAISIFKTQDELVEYTVEEGRYFPKEDAYAGGLLKYLLREIHNKYEGSRGKRGRSQGKTRGRYVKGG